MELKSEFENKVVIVTGAGRGLGRSHAIEFARRGAKVCVNDLGGAVDGTGTGNTAQAVVDEIKQMGGTAIASTADVSDYRAAKSIIDDTLNAFGSIHIVINNAGILRDKTFRNLTMENFLAVLNVHLMGAVHVTRASWPVLCDQGWGRVVFTSSGSGIFGNFGQSNYAAAKMGLIGLMNVLKLEGIKKGIRINCLAPGAITRMTENIPNLTRGTPEQVSPAVLYLSSENAPNGIILQASGGRFSIIDIGVSQGVELGETVSYENFIENADQLLKDRVFFPGQPLVP